MNNKRIFIINIIIMIAAVACMSVNRFVSPLPDLLIRTVGVIMLINLFVFGYSTVKLKNAGK